MRKKIRTRTIPSDEVLVSDLRSMVNLYQRLKAKVGTEFQEENIEELIEREEREICLLLMIVTTIDTKKRIYAERPANLQDMPIPRRLDQ